MLSRLSRSLRLFRFSTTNSSTSSTTSSTTSPTSPPPTSILSQQQHLYQTPIHLRPYDPSRYQHPSQKIKLNTGYALMQIQPFPRARIMRISYNILQKLRQLPPTAIYRKLTEQRIKHIMKLTDEIEDISELEKALGMETLEFFISQLVEEFEQIEVAKELKPWEKVEGDRQGYVPEWVQGNRQQRYARPGRVESKFVKEKEE